jgi:hypothetical protein
VVADLDVIRELGTFETILKAVAPVETARELIADCRRIIDAVKALGPVYDERETKEILASVLSETLDWKDGGQLDRIRGRLSELSSGLSQTSRLKQGLESLRSYAVYHDLVAFLNRCRSHGVFLVPVGELEDWVPDLTTGGPSKKKKAEWANYAANRIRETPPQRDGLWDFVRQMASFQRDEGARLAGYPSRLSTSLAPGQTH